MNIDLRHGDCVAVMAMLEPDSIDSIVCDPPYDLTSSGRGSTPGSVAASKDVFARVKSGGFMGKAWDATGVAFNPDTWRAAYRILKPGGYLLAFGGTRTFHRLACALEDAGFEYRDTLCWLYGSGFPKSLDVSKAIDKASNVDGTYGGPKSEAHAHFIGKKHFKGDKGDAGWNRPWMDDPESIDKMASKYIPGSPESQAWSGWGTALKPAWEPVLMVRKPLIGTVAANVLKYGTGAINIDGTRIGGAGGTASTGEPNLKNNVYGHAMGGLDIEPLNAGRWPANVTLSHSLGCIQVGESKTKARVINRFDDGAKPFGGGAGHAYTSESLGDEDGMETTEVWECEPDCAVRLLDEQSGIQKSGIAVQRNRDGQVHNDIFGPYSKPPAEDVGYGDIGGSSRFFYTSKAGGFERSLGLEDMPVTGNSIPQMRALKNKQCLECGCRSVAAGTTELSCEHANSNFEWVDGNDEGHKGSNSNGHPTVKPLDLMRWLVRMVTRMGGTVLDPFTGSGSTGCAAVVEGMNFIGIEQDKGYLEIAKRRIEFWSNHQAPDVVSPELARQVKPGTVLPIELRRGKKADPQQGSLF